MPPVFTEQQAALQRVDADRRVLQAPLRQNESQSKNIVRVFAWCQDNCEPVSFDFSLPPGSRNFQITESVLHDLVLIRERDVTPDLIRLQKYDATEGLRVGFKIVQVFDAESHRRRFLIKRQEVKQCIGVESCVEHPKFTYAGEFDRGTKLCPRYSQPETCHTHLTSVISPILRSSASYPQETLPLV
jgi:hypothetical protein